MHVKVVTADGEGMQSKIVSIRKIYSVSNFLQIHWSEVASA
jgi:hypothetical protein